MKLLIIMLLGLLATTGCAAGGCCGSHSSAAVVYRCAHDGGERATPGPCPKCGMTLDERQRVSPR